MVSILIGFEKDMQIYCNVVGDSVRIAKIQVEDCGKCLK